MDSLTTEQQALIESLTQAGIIQIGKKPKSEPVTSAPKRKFKYPEPKTPDRVFVPWRGSTASAVAPVRSAEKTLADYYCPNCLTHVGVKKAEPTITVRLYRCECDKKTPKIEAKLTRDQLLDLRRLYVLGVIQADTELLAEFNKL